MLHSSDLYLTIARPSSSHSSDDKHVYRRAQRVWLLSLQPHHSHHIHLPGTARHDPESQQTHFSATPSEDEQSYTFAPTSSPGDIIGSVLLASSVPLSPDGIAHIIARGLGPEPESEPQDSKSSGGNADGADNDHHPRSSQPADPDPESWIPLALVALHRHQLLPALDRPRFMAWVRAYEAMRLDGEGEPVVRYEGLKKDEKGGKGFWVSHPGSTEGGNKDREEGGSATYGGLM